MSESEKKLEEKPLLNQPRDITSMAEFEEALRNAKGNVIVSMLQDDCSSCEDERPLVEKLAAKCPTATVLRVDVTKAVDVANKLDKFSGHEDGWGGTPTLLMAESGEKFAAGEVEEVEPGKALLKRLKCAR